MSKQQFKYLTTQNTLLFLSYCFVFIFCLSNDAIYSYDTYDYLKAMPYRQLGYVIFVKSFGIIFDSYFDSAVVLFQTLFSLFAVHYFYRQTSQLFKLNTILKIPLLAILLFPFFEPLSIVNNICSEGLGYGLYLLFIAFGIDILFKKNFKYMKFFALIYLLLIFIRGQFLFTTLIFALTYFLVYRKEIRHKKHLIILMIFIFIPIVASLTERTYHKLKDGFFKPTPLAFVSASTAPFYLSDKTDVQFIEDKHQKAIFSLAHTQLEKKGLLYTSNNNAESSYTFFHENMPKICNQTVHSLGRAYFQSKNPETPNDPNLAIAKAYFDIESACKGITISLIKANFNAWLSFYFKNMSYGFYSSLILGFVFITMIFSFIKTLLSYHKWSALIFLFSTLTLSNAMLIAFASHSIIRYLFYNYVLLFLILVSLFKLIKHGRQD